jgi:hypothetical protein
MKNTLIVTGMLFGLLAGCSSTPLDLWGPTNTSSATGSATEGIYIAEYQDDVVLKYTPDGALNDILYQASVGENLSGLVQYDAENLLILIDAASERVERLNVLTKEHSVYAQDIQFAGITLKLFFDPTTGIMLATEGNTIEKFINGIRINSAAAAFINAGLTTPQKAIVLSNGNILVLNTGAATQELRLYNSAATLITTITLPPGPDSSGDPYDIIEVPGSGYFYVAYYTTAISRIARFALNGTGGAVIFQDTPGVKDCTNPAAMALRPSGNFLVYCFGESGIIEMDTSGNIVKNVAFTNIRVSQMVELQ